VKPVFHPAARAELAAGADWYDERVSGLGDELISAVELATALIVEAPGRLPVVSVDTRARRVVVKDFPFTVVYTIAGDTVFILAIAHQKRRPFYWKRRLDDSP
jgi:hypothetical protein